MSTPATLTVSALPDGSAVASLPDPPSAVTVEYDGTNRRVAQTFDDLYAARRFYVAKDKAGKHPRVIGANTSDAKAIAVYVRVSTEEQNEQSQRAELERWLKGQGIDPATVRWYVDKGYSGDTLDRPEFEALQRAIFYGEVGTVVVYKIDRLSRKMCDGINIISEWCGRGLRIVCTSVGVDFNGTVGRIVAAVLLGIAEGEQAHRKERQAVGIAEAKKAGVYKGRKNGTLKAKPKEVLRRKNKGESIATIAKALDISKMTVCRYLRIARKEQARQAG
jgi:DNA invertase Pin-like site-specific DNA recombinase